MQRSMNSKLKHQVNHPLNSSKSKSKLKFYITSTQINAKKSSNKSSKLNTHALIDSKKQPFNSQTIIAKVQSPPLLKRQNTDQSIQRQNNFKSLKQSSSLTNYNGYQNKNKKQGQLQNKKMQSDQQSTNIQYCNKQSADQQRNSCKRQVINSFQKQRSNKSPGLNINLRNNEQSKLILNLPTNKVKIDKSPTPLKNVKDLKRQIKQKLKQFKSMVDIHEKENEYFNCKFEISKGERKRLDRMHFLELSSTKDEIYNLKEKIVSKIQKIN